jgi:gliding motility-associated-like protein
VSSEGCFRESEINLIVSSTQLPTGFRETIYECDDGIDLYDGIAVFDLTAVEAPITSQLPSGQMLDITYYETLNDAILESNAINNTTSYENSISGVQDIFIRVENENTSDCIAVGNFLRLNVEEVPINPGTIQIVQCDQSNDGMESIDTSGLNAQTLHGQSDVSIEYFDAGNNSLGNSLPNPFNTATQTLQVVLSNSLSQDADGACSTSFDLEFVVDAGVQAFPVPIFAACDDDRDGLHSFNTAGLEASILNGQSNVQIEFKDASGLTIATPFPDSFTTNSQIVTARVINPNNPLCFEETSVEFVVTTTPVAGSVEDDIRCDDDGNDGNILYRLNDFDAQILDGQSAAAHSISYHATDQDARTGTGALPNNYTSSADRETIHARIEAIENTGCYAVTSFDIGLAYQPEATDPFNLDFCDDISNDGLTAIDFNEYMTQLLDGQNPNLVDIYFYESLIDAENDDSRLALNYQTQSRQQTIYVRYENPNYPQCYEITSIDIEVWEVPVLDLPEEAAKCENGTLELSIDDTYDSYLWSTGDTTSSILIDSSGIYEVEAAIDHGVIECITSAQVNIVESTAPVIEDIIINDWTRDKNSIEVVVSGNGEYEFSLDGEGFQSSNIFTNLDRYSYEVIVRDTNGCGEAREQVRLLNYPAFFTPNNDGFNDRWQIINANAEPDSIIFIYDRYGRLIKQLSPLEAGWDGTFNGIDLPSSDYWFTFKRSNGEVLKGHFSLKR